MSAETRADFLQAERERQLRELAAKKAFITGTPRKGPSARPSPVTGQTDTPTPNIDNTSIGERRGNFVATGKVKLVEELSRNGDFRPAVGSSRNSVLFEVQPELSEAKSTNYVEIGEIRSSASLLIFMGSPSRNFSLNAKLVSRTVEEATQNFEYLHRLKGWSMPDPKYQTKISGTGVPRTLLLYAYGKNIRGVPTVIKTLNIDYPVDCDYILTKDKDARMPIILNVSVQLQETRTPDELTAFLIEEYKTGQLPWW